MAATFARCARTFFWSTSKTLNRICLSPSIPGRHAFSSSSVLAASPKKGLKYTSDHEWIDVQGDVGTVGITDFAQEKLGEIVYVECPSAGDTFEQFDACGAVESVKAASDILTPVSGTVIESNEELTSSPSLVNQSPFENGWLFKIKIEKPEELEGLMDETAYSNILE